MKTQISMPSLALLAVLCLTLTALPASADTLYDNGPMNGNTNAWTISSGFSVSDSFRVLDTRKVEEMIIGVWLLPGDSVTSVQFDLGSTPFGTDIFSGVLMASGFTDLGTNGFGFDLQLAGFSPPGMSLLVG